MSACKACQLEISECDKIKCSSCNNEYHTDCFGLPNNDKKTITRNKKHKLICFRCVETNKLEKNDTESTTTYEASIKQLMTEIRSENSYFKNDIIKELQEFKTVLQFNSDMFDRAIASNEKLHEELKIIKQQNSELLQENRNLKQQILDMKNEIVDLKQYSRRLNVEISNLPESQNEKTEEVVDVIMDKLEVKLKSDVIAAHRVPTTKTGKIKPIILQFNSANKKNEFLKAAKEKRLNAKDVNENFDAIPIYFNDHLCTELKQLLFECKKFKKEENFKYCWSKGGKIFLRYVEGSKVFRIKCLADLKNVTK